MANIQLNGKVCVVTGAASGIGKRIAEVYAEAGGKVVIADLQLEAAEATAQAIRDAGGEALAVAMDVTSEQQVIDGVAKAVATYGQVDVLVSNAGIQIINKITEFSFEDWKKMLAIHLDGAFLTTRECMKDMEKRGAPGAIILMGSVHSHLASPLKAPYVTAKHGLLGLARTVAKEGGPLGIRANVICPGLVLTEAALFHLTDEYREAGLKAVPHTRLGKPEDIAAAVTFLASDDGEWVNGQVWHVNGGTLKRD